MKRATIAIVILAGLGIATIVVVGFRAAKIFRNSFAGRLLLDRDLALQAQDYAEARQTFQTRLLRTGPSPQPVTEESRIPAGVQEIDYTSGELQLAAYVDGAPPDGGKRPAVLFLHGGFAFGDEDLEMPQPFRDSGFIVMVPILRGENGQPGNFTLFYDEVNDVLAAAEALAELPYVDAKRLFVSGHSAGGTLAMLAAMTTDRFRAAAPISGSCNQLQQPPSLTPFDTSNRREFEMRSPLAYATSFKCPVQICFGNQESWAYSESRATADRAQKAGQVVDVIVVPGDHMTCVPESIRRSIEFFNRVAPPQPATQ